MLLLLWFHLLWNPLRGGRQILARLFSGRPSAQLCRKTVDNGNSNNSFISWTITQLLANLNSFSFYALKNQRCSHHHCIVCGSWMQRISDDVTVDCWTDIPAGLGNTRLLSVILSGQWLRVGFLFWPKLFWRSELLRFVPVSICLLEVLIRPPLVSFTYYGQFERDLVQSRPSTRWNGSPAHDVQSTPFPRAWCTRNLCTRHRVGSTGESNTCVREMEDMVLL